jgi:hypothetical protein
MPAISGINELQRQITQLLLKSKSEDDMDCIVGYTAAYSLFVHENMQAHHTVGQAKFLEQPARELTNNGTLAGIIADAKRQGKSLGQALLLAGLRLQRDSQRLCPVDTGNMRASAFTRLEPRR